MKYFLSGCILLLSASDATAYCSVPNAPFQEAADWQIQRYYKKLEEYQYCMQRQLKQQEFSQQQHNNQPKLNFNGGFFSGNFTH